MLKKFVHSRSLFLGVFFACPHALAASLFGYKLIVVLFQVRVCDRGYLLFVEFFVEILRAKIFSQYGSLLRVPFLLGFEHRLTRVSFRFGVPLCSFQTRILHGITRVLPSGIDDLFPPLSTTFFRTGEGFMAEFAF